MTKTSATTKPSGHKPRLVFFGNETIATGVATEAPVFRMLLEQGYDIAAVILKDAGTRSRKVKAHTVETVAIEHSIPVFTPLKLAEIRDELAGLQAEAGVLVAFGRIVPEWMIELFPKGIINVHPSLLPRHRGSTPLESAILQGDTETGVSIMALAREMDAGPVYGQAPVALEGNETKVELAATLLDIAAAMLCELLPGILSGEIVPAPQDHASATYDQMIDKKDGVLDFSKPAQRLEREIRAYAGWPQSRTTVAGIEVIVTGVHLETAISGEFLPGTVWTDEMNRKILIATSQGTLSVDRLKPAGKKEMTAREFLAGHRSKL